MLAAFLETNGARYGSVKRDLEALAVVIVKCIRQPWSTILPSIIDAAERDKNLGEIQSRIHAHMRSAFVEVIERGRRRGEISKTRDAREVIASILGPLMTRRFRRATTTNIFMVKSPLAHLA